MYYNIEIHTYTNAIISLWRLFAQCSDINKSGRIEKSRSVMPDNKCRAIMNSLLRSRLLINKLLGRVYWRLTRQISARYCAYANVRAAAAAAKKSVIEHRFSLEISARSSRAGAKRRDLFIKEPSRRTHVGAISRPRGPYPFAMQF